MSLPRWLEPLLDSDQMRATDTWAIEERGVPSLDLMERAGEGLARVVSQYGPAGRVAVVCGKGNNGGDGFVAARLLRQAGREVEVLTVWGAEWIEGDAKTMLERLPGEKPQPFSADRLASAHVIVDALLGTGFQGTPREPADAVIAAVNAAGKRVVAADVPSGVNASTGEVEGEAVRAVATATFHRAKLGLWVAPGKGHAGETHVIDIGIPRGGPRSGAAKGGLIGAGVLRDIPRRGAGSTKFTSGNVVILGGASGLTGAPCMSALAAMRTGAGYVTVGAPASLELSFTVRLLEAMMVGLPETGGALSTEAAGPALNAIQRADAVVLGPGLSKKPGARDFALEMFERIDVPLVIDADGLNALEGVFPEDLPTRPWPTVLTPHAGELGRLLGVDSAEVGKHRLEHARAAAKQAKAFVVLKGDDTLVVSPSGTAAVSRGAAPALATAGTGDVLSGVIGAMLAKGLAPAHAASAGVYAHVRAGQLAAAPHGPDGVIASDVIHALPAALDA
jgi:NAD(P)H-hydrate epimerase